MTEEEHPELKLRKVMSNLNFDLDEVKEIADEYDSLHNPELFRNVIEHLLRNAI